MRWLVGDVQGCARELEKLLETVRFDAARDELWCLGDLVNRGPDSAAALRLWSDVGGRAVLGNHDVYALLAHSGSQPRKRDTLDDLFADPRADELLATLRRQPLLVHLPSPGGSATDVWVVHAGIHPGWSDLHAVASRINAAPHDDAWLQSEETSFAVRARCCTAAGALCKHTGPPAGCPPPSRPWDSFYQGPTLVVHGHWAQRGFYRAGFAMGLDTGCVYGGDLTAWCQDEDRIVTVPAQKRKR